MNVVFLDVDGVLNSNGLIECNENLILGKKYFKRLYKLVKETNANIVLHSGWRFWFDENMYPTTPEAQLLIDLLHECGMNLYDKTPDFSTKEIKETRKFSLVKAQEILAWLRMHNDIKSYVVLEDLELKNEEIRKHQIKTDSSNGLSDADVEQAIQILKLIIN